MKKINLIATVFAVCSTSLLLTACGGGAVADTSSSSDVVADTSSPSDVVPDASSLSDVEVEGLLFMREEEELARDLYLDIYEAKGSRLTVFENISENAESQHAEAIRLLLVKYGIDDPSTGFRDTYTDPELQELYDLLLNIAVGSDDLAALRVGALVEETDIQDIETYKASVSAEHTDIISTYDNLLCGSRNHLRSFVKQIESLSGTDYVTQVPALDAEVREILSSDNESCGN